MEKERNEINRRNFLRTIGSIGLGSVIKSSCVLADKVEPNTVDPNTAEKTQKPECPQVPKRKLGKTGVEISCLSFGTFLVDVDNQILLRKNLQLGVTCWDTAYNYSGGNSEIGIGKFLSKNPEARKKLFIVTKASLAKTVEEIEQRLQTSLKRMNIKCIDLYYGIHQLSDPANLTEELRQWAEDAKKRKLIRFFGFSTDSNMAQCLTAAAKLDWIDAILIVYNFRYMKDPEMQAAIESCHKAGVGLIAMKTQAHSAKPKEGDDKLSEHFRKRGFTEGQAKIKLVLEDKRFSSACVGMKNVGILNSNVAAVLDKTELTQTDRDTFTEYAQATCDGYCAGCAHICNSALPDMPYVSEIMRYLMYHNSYGQHDVAKELFAQIPSQVRNKLLRTDYRLAEARCPQHMPISKLIAEAVSKLA